MAEAPTQDQYVAQQLAARKLKDTPANRKKLKNEWSQKYRGGATGDWRTIFKNEFPQFASLLDNAEGEALARTTFGDDLIDLFLDAAKNPDNYDFLSEAGQKAWLNKVQSTKFYVNNLPTQREWDLLPKNQQNEQIATKIQLLRTQFSDLELDDSQLANLAVYSLRNKASELQEGYYAYSLAYKTAKPTTADPLNAAKDTKLMLAKLDYKPDDIDKKIESMLTGQLYAGKVYTQELLEKEARRNAKILYPHYSKQIDEGNNLDEIFEPYQQIASQILEVNPNTIKRNDPKFKIALDADAQGNGMSGTAWTYKLKSDPIYNYGSTQQANQEVNAIIANLERAFGKVR